MNSLARVTRFFKGDMLFNAVCIYLYIGGSRGEKLHYFLYIPKKYFMISFSKRAQLIQYS